MPGIISEAAQRLSNAWSRTRPGTEHASRERYTRRAKTGPWRRCSSHATKGTLSAGWNGEPNSDTLAAIIARYATATLFVRQGR